MLLPPQLVSFLLYRHMERLKPSFETFHKPRGRPLKVRDANKLCVTKAVLAELFSFCLLQEHEQLTVKKKSKRCQSVFVR